MLRKNRPNRQFRENDEEFKEAFKFRENDVDENLGRK